jgi:virginiamycin B lyase
VPRASAVEAAHECAGLDRDEQAARNVDVRFDPKSEKFQTWIIPSGGGVVRNMMRTPQGDLVLACSGVNRVAFVDVKGD